MKRKITITLKNGEYNIEFIRKDGSKKTEWGYWSLNNAFGDIEAWLREENPTPD